MRQRTEINQYEFIDALRGIAILLVILTHISSSVTKPSLPILRLIAASGMFGVQLFYVVSALTLFLSMEQRSQIEKRPTLNFFIRRIFRIVPLFYLAVGAYTIIMGTGPNYWAPYGIDWWQYLLTLLFLNGWHPEAINAIVPLGWSIAIEMSFYPFIPFLYGKIKNIGGAILFIIASLILQVLLTAVYKPILLQHVTGYIVQAYFYLWFFSQLPIFGLGILAYLILRNYQPASNQSLGNALLLTFVFMFVAFLTINTYLNLIPIHFFYGITFMILTAGLYFNPSRLFVNPFTQWIGKISYSLYLVHFIFLPYVKTWLNLEPYFGKTVQFVLYFMIVLAISSGISFFTYRFVELSGVNLGKKLIQRLERRNPQVVAESIA